MELIEPDRRLWPESEPSPTASEFLVLGDPAKGRVLIPMSPTSVTAESLERFHGGMGLGDRIARRGAATLGRLGLLKALARDRRYVDLGLAEDSNSLRHLLSSVTGEDHIAIAVSFGPTRANQKPVIRIMREDGTTIAFAKIGWSSLTSRLIEKEVAALQTSGVERLQNVAAPPVLFDGKWQEFRIAIFGAILGRPGKLTPTETAFLEVASLWGRTESRLEGSEFARQLKASADRVEGPIGETSRSTIEKLLSSYGSDSFEFAGWHGDWTPWNNARFDDSKIVLWDWERAGDPAPVGFDSIHYRFQPEFLKRQRALIDLLEIATAGLERHSTHKRETLGQLYSASIALRHLQPDSGDGPFGRSAALIEELRELLDR